MLKKHFMLFYRGSWGVENQKYVKLDGGVEFGELKSVKFGFDFNFL